MKSFRSQRILPNATIIRTMNALVLHRPFESYECVIRRTSITLNNEYCTIIYTKCMLFITVRAHCQLSFRSESASNVGICIARCTLFLFQSQYASYFYLSPTHILSFVWATFINIFRISFPFVYLFEVITIIITALTRRVIEPGIGSMHFGKRKRIQFMCLCNKKVRKITIITRFGITRDDTRWKTMGQDDAEWRILNIKSKKILCVRLF